MFFHRLVQASLGAGCLVLGASLQSIAQIAPTLPVTPQTEVAAVRLQPYLDFPDLPPIQPVFPDVQDMRLVLRLGERRVYLYDGDTVEATYPVAIGKPGWETPTGSYEVLYMLDQPGWTNPFTGDVVPPGPDNPLGERWIAFWTDGQNYIGFHGTPNRESVGQAASHGCVRMYNEHIRELYELVEVGTPVMVEN